MHFSGRRDLIEQEHSFVNEQLTQERLHVGSRSQWTWVYGRICLHAIFALAMAARFIICDAVSSNTLSMRLGSSFRKAGRGPTRGRSVRDRSLWCPDLHKPCTAASQQCYTGYFLCPRTRSVWSEPVKVDSHYHIGRQVPTHSSRG